MTVVSDRQLNRTTLERQLLLERAPVTSADVLRLLVGLQGQDPELPYVGLWNRVAGFRMGDLTSMIEAGAVARATLFRRTQHLMLTEDYAWIRPLLAPLLAQKGAEEIGAHAAELLDGRTMTRPELGRALAERLPGRDGTTLARIAQVALAIVHPYPDGSWGHRGQTPFVLAEQWLGRPWAEGERADLVMRYLDGFGPASVRDMQAWSGLTRMRTVFEELRPRLVSYRSEHGTELFDLPGRPLADPDRPAPVRFLAGFDNVTFGYADRRRIIADEHRPVLVERAALTVDGYVRGSWKVRGGELDVRLFGPITKRQQREVDAEAAAITEFMTRG